MEDMKGMFLELMIYQQWWHASSALQRQQPTNWASKRNNRQSNVPGPQAVARGRAVGHPWSSPITRSEQTGSTSTPLPENSVSVEPVWPCSQTKTFFQCCPQSSWDLKLFWAILFYEWSLAAPTCPVGQPSAATASQAQFEFLEHFLSLWWDNKPLWTAPLSPAILDPSGAKVCWVINAEL